ncbi:MAG: DnaD domain protein [Mycoplasmoidaceae bacterium]|nr:DnaD domain protein [Mycoplasmoidaceae bacterium]
MFNNFFFTVKKVNEFKLNINALYDLYLPVVGQSATSFYVILSNMVDNQVKNQNLTFNSANICKQLNVSNEELALAKDKLEAIGLLSTFISTNNKEDNILIFVVKPALAYQEFIANPKLKKLLINQVGPTNFEYLEYKNAPESQLQDAIEITRNFDQVFNNEDLKNVHILDFEKLYQNIQKTTSLPLVIDEDCKNIIQDVYAKYQISLKDIEMVLYDSINDMDGFNKVNANLLIQNFNKLVNKQVTLPVQTVNRDFRLFTTGLDKQMEDKIYLDYKMCNAELYLSLIFKKSLNADEKQIINILRTKYHLNDEIINVLVDFSLNKTNGKLNKKYITKAAHTVNGLGLINASQVVAHLKNANKDTKVSIEDKVDQYFNQGF